MQPVDPTTGLQCGMPPRGVIEVFVGYLVTHADGFVTRLGPDRARAEQYAATHHATIEPMFVRRSAPVGCT